MKQPNLWTYIKQILTKSNDYEYDKKIASAYILCLILSHDKQSLPYVQKINKYLFLIDDKSIYDYLFDQIPKGYRYIKYIKSQRKNNEKDDLHLLPSYLELSSEEIIKIKNQLNL